MADSDHYPNAMDTRTAEDYVGGIELKTLRVRGGGPPYVKRGRAVRYLRRDLDRWLESLRVTSTSDATAARYGR